MHRKSQARRAVALILFGVTLVACRRPTPGPTSTQGATLFPDPGEPTADAPKPDAYERFDVGEDLYVRKVQSGAFVITHAFPWAGNAMIVEMKSSDLVLVDTPCTPEATREVLAWAETQFGERKITAINTGFHYDNLGGNGYLIERGIPVYGSALTAELLQERGEAMRAMTLDWLQAPRYKRYYEAHETLVYVAPTHLFDLDEGLQLEFGDEIVQVYYPGPSHAPDNVVVYFPNRKILFGTCAIIGGDKVGNTSDADLEAWPESLRDLDRFDFDVLVPGHGDRLDPGLLKHTIDLLTRSQ
jgi:glyoxylase-like metal-dependent hydrolase (beta-lactamase superfamily II)